MRSAPFVQALGVFVLACGLVHCVGDDPASTVDRAPDASSSSDGSSGTSSSGAASSSSSGSSSGGSSGAPDAADDAADAAVSILSWPPAHWPMAAPFPGTGTFTAIDAVGNTYLAFTFSTPTKVRSTPVGNTGGVADIGVVKLDTTGAVVWTKVYGGSGDDTVEDMRVDSAGNVYLVGKFASATIAFGAKTLTRLASGSDPFAAKLDTNGTAVAAWDFGAGSNGSCVRLDVRAGKVLVGCNVFGATSWPMQNDTTKSLPAVAGAANAAFALLRDSDLKAAWVNSAGGTQGDGVPGLALTQNGDVGYVVVSYNNGPISDSNGSLTSAGAASTGYMVARVDLTDGDVGWHFENANEADVNRFFVRAVTATLTSVVVAGELRGTRTLGNSQSLTATGIDVVVASHSVVNGTGMWARKYGNAGDQLVSALAVDATNHVYAGITYLGDGFAIDGTNLPATAAFSRSGVVFEVLPTPNAATVPFTRLINASAGDAGATNVGIVAIAMSPSSIVAGGYFRGVVDLGDGVAVSSFDPMNAGWNAYVVGYKR